MQLLAFIIYFVTIKLLGINVLKKANRQLPKLYLRIIGFYRYEELINEKYYKEFLLMKLKNLDLYWSETVMRCLLMII